MKNNTIPDLKRYQSLDYIKTRYVEKVQKVVKADARYELGLGLSIVALIYRRGVKELRFLLGNKEFSSSNLSQGEKIPRYTIDEEYEKLLQKKQDLRKLSPYGRGLLRKAIVRLAALYSKFYYLPFLQPLPIFLAFEDLLSVRKRKYSVARDVLKCYSNSLYRNSLQQIRECVEHVLSKGLSRYVDILDPQKLELIKEKFIEALNELLTLSSSMGIDVLADV